ncbi:hypothetical protein CWI37_1077p0010 [Hamiltosporidium tvaerminnensis]|uniref:Uncharacterized protein n=1 Tax=Hamiltosporidium tvaerminnensis TaxID=1176355 RepID=A0A4Q9KYX6_9MICR|nr:hypothetical protein CWI37_1077p0010 [Hamiltosporidium tvaerminnensis]
MKDSNVLGFCYSCSQIEKMIAVIIFFDKISQKNNAKEDKLQFNVIKKHADNIKDTNLVIPPYIFSLKKLKEFKDKYNTGVLTRFGLHLTLNTSEINVINKLVTLSEELASEIEVFSFLNANLQDKSIQISIAGDKLKNGTKNDLNLFQIFILHKANVFDKNNIYDSFLKCIIADDSLREILLACISDIYMYFVKFEKYSFYYNYKIEVFLRNYLNNKFGTASESNLQESIKFLAKTILTELPKNECMSIIIMNLIRVYRDGFEDPDCYDEITMVKLIKEGSLCISRFISAIYID